MAGELRSGGGIYELIWKDLSLLIRADRLAEDSKYNVTAEIAVKSTIPGVPQHIHQARLNLVSTISRRSFIKELESRLPDLPWGSLVEELSVRVLQAYREGQPFIRMSEYAPTEHVSHRLAPFLQEGQATVFYGQGETGKSWVSLFLAILIAAPLPYLNFTPEPGAVLYLDYETGEDDVWERVNMITAGLGIAIPDHFYYRYMVQPVAGDIETIQRKVLEDNISLVVVDSAAPASVEPETSAGATAYFQALRSLKCTTLTIAHQEASGKQDRPFGSVFWRNLPRANYLFRSASEPDATELVVAVKQTKANNGRRMKDMGLALEFVDHQVNFRFANLLNVEGLSKTLSPHDRLLHALSHGGKSLDELSEELEMPKATVKYTLSRYKGRDFIDLERGLWGAITRPE